MLSLEEARKALGWEGRRLSDDQVRERADAAHGLSEIFLELWRKEGGAVKPAPKQRRSKAA